MDTEVIKGKNCITYVDGFARIVGSQNDNPIGSYYREFGLISDPF
jgi:hypothetical protein